MKRISFGFRHFWITVKLGDSTMDVYEWINLMRNRAFWSGRELFYYFAYENASVHVNQSLLPAVVVLKPGGRREAQPPSSLQEDPATRSPAQIFCSRMGGISSLTQFTNSRTISWKIRQNSSPTAPAPTVTATSFFPLQGIHFQPLSSLPRLSTCVLFARL